MPLDLVNIPREITAATEWVFVLFVVISSKKRVTGWRLIAIIALFLPFQISYMLITGHMPLTLWLLGMFGGVFLMWLVIYITCDVNLIGATYLVAKAFVIAEFSASLQWQFYYFFINTVTGLYHPITEYIFAGIFYSIIFTAGYFIENRYRKNKYRLNIRKSDMVSILTIMIAVFTISNLSFLNVESPISSSSPEEIFYIRTLVDLCGVILIYMQREHRYALHSQNDLMALQSAFQNHYNFYRSSKDSLDMINVRLHDLKHQLTLIKAEANATKREQYLSEIERNINNYGIRTDTGYHVLDVIITSKNMRCIDDDITFTYVIDGKLLEFMSVVDISSLFGNAIDNAIESVNKINEIDKRLIKLAVYSQNSLLMIKIENYYENNLVYEDGILTSTKGEKDKHGYGIKSIKTIAEKYGGNVTIDTANNWFVLRVLIPIHQ